MPCEEIVEGSVYVHDEGQLRYGVEAVLPNLTGYERTHEIGAKAVLYVQLEDGVFPKGTRYVRDEDDFKQQFSALT